MALRTGCRILVLHRELIEGKRALGVWKFGGREKKKYVKTLRNYLNISLYEYFRNIISIRRIKLPMFLRMLYFVKILI